MEKTIGFNTKEMLKTAFLLVGNVENTNVGGKHNR
jgi:hypothetical protein